MEHGKDGTGILSAQLQNRPLPTIDAVRNLVRRHYKDYAVTRLRGTDTCIVEAPLSAKHIGMLQATPAPQEPGKGYKRRYIVHCRATARSAYARSTLLPKITPVGFTGGGVFSHNYAYIRCALRGIYCALKPSAYSESAKRFMKDVRLMVQATYSGHTSIASSTLVNRLHYSYTAARRMFDLLELAASYIEEVISARFPMEYGELCELYPVKYSDVTRSSNPVYSSMPCDVLDREADSTLDYNKAIPESIWHTEIQGTTLAVDYDIWKKCALLSSLDISSVPYIIKKDADGKTYIMMLFMITYTEPKRRSTVNLSTAPSTPKAVQDMLELTRCTSSLMACSAIIHRLLTENALQKDIDTFKGEAGCPLDLQATQTLITLNWSSVISSLGLDAADTRALGSARYIVQQVRPLELWTVLVENTAHYAPLVPGHTPALANAFGQNVVTFINRTVTEMIKYLLVKESNAVQMFDDKVLDTIEHLECTEYIRREAGLILHVPNNEDEPF